ncbi:LamG-like jellyroll fold domain-containing protein [Planctomicrobium sp. SH661]|uniref:LamG-like jellyroll fold domain-containing protein n=1 Tax=Planctomicrobium sp. SH661 TaxID=3448124 RepID=UPI003F5B1E42
MKKGFVFLEWSKDETPRRFRYAMRPLFPIWNPMNLKWDEIPVHKRPMVEVENAPFSSDLWTHVVFTVSNANDKSRRQSGRLYLNGDVIADIEEWDLTFGWDPQQTRLVLGASFIGHMDDLSVFDRSLDEFEVKQLYKLENGVADLY